MHKQKLWGIVPAAGLGTRAGGGPSKLLRVVAGKAVIQWTLEALINSSCLTGIVIALRNEDSSIVNEVVDLIVASNRPLILFCEGGGTRQESVFNALKWISANKADATHVLIHDAARCLVSPRLVLSTAKELQEFDAVTCAIPVADSLKLVSGEMIVERSVPREKLWAIQTPQAFKLPLILDAHFDAQKFGGAFTDDAGLLEAKFPIKVVQGERTNIKLTFPEDFCIAEKLLA